jgi:hypothetical protein
VKIGGCGTRPSPSPSADAILASGQCSRGRHRMASWGPKGRHRPRR